LDGGDSWDISNRRGEIAQIDLTGSEISLQLWTFTKKLRRQLHLTEIMQVWGEKAGEGGEELHEDIHFHSSMQPREGQRASSLPFAVFAVVQCPCAQQASSSRRSHPALF